MPEAAPPLTVHPRSRRPRHPVLFGVWVGVVAVIALGLILFLVLPTRTWLSQRSALDSAGHRLAAIRQENAALQARAKALQSPAEIERLARQQYGMIRPGEQAFAVTPGVLPTQLPSGWPF